MKTESDLTKLARWIVPGWISILAFLTFVACDIIATYPEQNEVIETLNTFMGTVEAQGALVAGLFIAAAGVPLGFLIYQIYFFFRWNSPFSRHGLLDPLISGRMGDLDRLSAGIKSLAMNNGGQWRKEWVTSSLFEKDHGFRWRYIELLFTEAAQWLDKKSDGATLYARHRYLHEIVHTLGAATAAVYLGFLAYVAVRLMSERRVSAEQLIVSLLVVVILLALLGRETHAEWPFGAGEGEERTELDRPEPAEDDPVTDVDGPEPAKDGPVAAYEFSIFESPTICITGALVSPAFGFVFLVAVTHFFSNPAANGSWSTTDTLIRILIWLIVAAVWLNSARRSSWEVARGDALVLLASMVIALAMRFGPEAVRLWIDWPFHTAVLAFLVANLTLLHNRHNAKEDMLALEYYALRRYLDERNA